jgi:hypothetical protein
VEPGKGHRTELCNRYEALRTEDWPELAECRCAPCSTCELVGDENSEVMGRGGKETAGKDRNEHCKKNKDRFRRFMPSEEEEMGFQAGISTIAIEEVETINAVVSSSWKGYQRVDILVDSGAVENAVGPQHLPGYDILPSEGSRSELHYLVLDGGRIPNKGEQKVKVVTEKGHWCGLTFQVADATRPILSVGEMTDNGHDMKFIKKGGSIANGVTGQVTKFEKKNGAYIMIVWLMPNAQSGQDKTRGVEGKSGFSRQRR